MIGATLLATDPNTSALSTPPLLKLLVHYTITDFVLSEFFIVISTHLHSSSMTPRPEKTFFDNWNTLPDELKLHVLGFALWSKSTIRSHDFLPYEDLHDIPRDLADRIKVQMIRDTF
jgi:hypothetical protein